jgi:outer membrane protein assembly factor BamB
MWARLTFCRTAKEQTGISRGNEYQAARRADRPWYRVTLLAAAVCLLSGRAWSAEQNWPQWRGPQGTGAAPTAKPPLEWNDKKNVKWKVAIPGSGTATPVVWQNQIFIQTAIPSGKKAAAEAKADSADPDADADAKDGSAKESAGEQSAQNAEQPRGRGRGRRPGGGRPGGARGGGGATEEHRFVLMALDRSTGKTLWQQTARTEVPHEGHHADNSYASHSPVTDGTCVCAYFGSHGLYCYDMSGKPKWEKDLGRQQTRNGFGEGSSPALFGNTIVVNWDHEGDDFIAAFDKETGNELWRQPRDEHTSWGTPIVVQHEGHAQVVTAATDKIRSYDLATGELVWQCAGLTTNSIPSPVAAGDMVYVTSGFKGNALLAIRLGRTGDLTGTDAIVWKHDKNTPYVPSPLLYGNRLYFYSSNNAILSCFDVTTGKSLFGPKRLDGMRNVYASPVGAAGRVYLVGRDGGALVIKDANDFEVLATNRLDDSFDSSPALVDNLLLLRGKAHLYCLAEE